MTVRDLDNAFKLYVDKADSQASSDFLIGERQKFLNDAQLRLARELSSNKEDSQDSVDKRLSLQAYTEITIPTSDAPVTVTLPSNYLRHGRLTATLKAPYENYTVPVKVISEDEYSDVLEDVFNKPLIGEPVACFLKGTIEIQPITAYSKLNLNYYKRWALFDLTNGSQVPEAAEELHPTIVQYAVQLALESTENPRVPTQAQISNLTSN